MGQLEERLTSFGRRVAAQQDRAPEAWIDVDRGRARLLADPPPAQRLAPWRASLQVAALVAAVIALVIVLRPRTPIPIELGAAHDGSTLPTPARTAAGVSPLATSIASTEGPASRAPSAPVPGTPAADRGALDADAGVAPTPVSDAGASGGDAGDPLAPTAPAPTASAAMDWRSHAAGARYEEALAAAEREGFDAVCSTASAGDLQELGYAARLAGSVPRSIQALTALRRRFPRAPEAAPAAFMLGRMAQDDARDPAAAAGWLTRYLEELPGGEHAAEALGRLLVASDDTGDDAAARRIATRYLTLFPAGPYAARAKLVLARGRAATAPR